MWRNEERPHKFEECSKIDIGIDNTYIFGTCGPGVLEVSSIYLCNPTR